MFQSRDHSSILFQDGDIDLIPSSSNITFPSTSLSFLFLCGQFPSSLLCQSFFLCLFELQFLSSDAFCLFRSFLTLQHILMHINAIGVELVISFPRLCLCGHGGGVEHGVRDGGRMWGAAGDGGRGRRCDAGHCVGGDVRDAGGELEGGDWGVGWVCGGCGLEMIPDGHIEDDDHRDEARSKLTNQAGRLASSGLDADIVRNRVVIYSGLERGTMRAHAAYSKTHQRIHSFFFPQNIRTHGMYSKFPRMQSSTTNTPPRALPNPRYAPIAAGTAPRAVSSNARPALIGPSMHADARACLCAGVP